jgi:hypothetical protein
MYAPIATIMNFLMQFTERSDILSFVLQTFKRLYNSFPIFRKNLEDPLISCFVGILKNYKREQQIAINDNKVTEKLTEAKNLYIQTQIFVNFLLTNPSTSPNFISKIE